MPLNRKQFLQLAGASAVGLPGVVMSQELQPQLRRIRAVTIGAPDVSAIEALYTAALGYEVVESTKVSDALATSWGAPAAAGGAFLTMRPATGEDVTIRAVQIAGVDGYRPMNSLGWNAYEIIVNDLDVLHERMLKTPFNHIGGPQSLGGSFASIHASQYIGPAGEVLYFNCEKGDRATSILPDPGEDVGRPNICILAAADLPAAMRFYAEKLGMPEGGNFSTPISVVAKAQEMAAGTIYKMGLTRLVQPGNAIEFDEYPAAFGERARSDGHLPPGNTMASFEVDDLDALDVSFIAPPAALYAGQRSAVVRGTAGELIELIEAT